MAATSNALLNTLRWGGLVFGVGYGFNRHRTLTKIEAKERAAAEIKHKEHLIQEAKLAFARKKASANPSVISDPDSPDFDLEKYLLFIEKGQ